MVDWTGNSKTTFSTLGASNHSDYERADDDFYETPPEGITRLLAVEHLDPNSVVWECAAGRGAISRELEAHGYKVKSTELRDRGYGETGVDFLQSDRPADIGKLTILTNPPYSEALPFVQHSLDLLREGESAYFLLRLSFLEGQKRMAFFEGASDQRPETVFVFGKRITCNRNGTSSGGGQGAIAFAWFKWTKGFRGETTVKWI